MKKSCFFLLSANLVACAKTAPMDTVDSLVADPDRLKEVMRQCREDPVKMGNAICNTASEAFRRKFMGDGKAQYTPHP